MSMTRRTIGAFTAVLLSFAAFGVQAQAKAPEALIKEVSTDVLDAVKADKSIQAGDIRKVIALVDQKVLPYVNFQRMTASAVGRYWRQATPEQQKRLQDEFKLLLVRTYSGALSQVSSEQTVELKPMRSAPTDTEVVVRGVPAKLAALAKLYGVDVLLLEHKAAGAAGNEPDGQRNPAT